MTLQERFWHTVQNERIPVIIDLQNGNQHQGIIRAFDDRTVLLESEGRQKLLYQQAFTAVSPLRKVSMPDAEGVAR